MTPTPRRTLALTALVLTLAAGCSPSPDRDAGIGDARIVDASDRPDRSLECSFDEDNDGVIDDRCAGGSDCDDANASIPGMERCANLADEDCDGSVDEDACMVFPGDTCEAPIRVTESVTLELSGAPVRRDVEELHLGCLPRGELSYEVQVELDLAEPRSLRVGHFAHGVWTRAGFGVALVGSCGRLDTEDCEGQGLELFEIDRLEAGRHRLVLSRWSSLTKSVRFELGAPVTAPDNDRCESPLALGEGDHPFSLRGARPDLGSLCARGDAVDVVYTLDLTEPRDVELYFSDLDTVNPGAISVRSACGASERACTQTDTVFGVAPIRLRSLEAGRYLVAVHGDAGVSGTLRVALSAPTPRLPGDLCEEAVPLAPGVDWTGTLVGAGRELPIMPGCENSYDTSADRFFRISVPTESSLELRTGEFAHTVHLHTGCAPMCVPQLTDLLEGGGMFSPRVVRARYRRLAPGDYWVQLSGQDAEAALRADLGPPTVVSARDGGDTCATAAPLAPGDLVETAPGVTLDSTFSAREECLEEVHVPPLDGSSPYRDRFFRFDLSSAARVRIHVLEPDGQTRAAQSAIQLFRSCADALPLDCLGGLESGAFDARLAAGRYIARVIQHEPVDAPPGPSPVLPRRAIELEVE